MMKIIVIFFWVLAPVLMKPDVNQLYDENGGYLYPKPAVPFPLPSENNLVVVPIQRKIENKNNEVEKFTTRKPEYLPPLNQKPEYLPPEPSTTTTTTTRTTTTTTRKPDYLPPKRTVEDYLPPLNMLPKAGKPELRRFPSVTTTRLTTKITTTRTPVTAIRQYSPTVPTSTSAPFIPPRKVKATQFPPNLPFGPQAPIETRDKNFPPLIFLGTSTVEPAASNNDIITLKPINSSPLIPSRKFNGLSSQPSIKPQIKSVRPIFPSNNIERGFVKFSTSSLPKPMVLTNNNGARGFNKIPQNSRNNEVFVSNSNSYDYSVPNTQLPITSDASSIDETRIPSSTTQPFSESIGYNYSKPSGTSFEANQQEATNIDEIKVSSTTFSDMDGYEYNTPRTPFEIPSQPEATNIDEIRIPSTTKPITETNGYDYSKPSTPFETSSEPEATNVDETRVPAVTNTTTDLLTQNEDGYNYSTPSIPFENPSQPEATNIDESRVPTSTFQPFNETDGYLYNTPAVSFDISSQPEATNIDEARVTTSTAQPFSGTEGYFYNTPLIPFESPSEQEATNIDETRVPSSTQPPLIDTSGYDYLKPTPEFETPSQPDDKEYKLNNSRLYFHYIY